MEHVETPRYQEELRSIMKEMQRIVMRMDNVYDAISQNSPPAQFFVLNMITKARRLRNDWQRFVNKDRTILDEFDRWKDWQVYERIHKEVQARELEHRFTRKQNRIIYDRPAPEIGDTEPKARLPKLTNDLRCRSFTRQGRRCNFDPYYKCIKHSKFARLQKGITDDATIEPSVVDQDDYDSGDGNYVN